jgi:hypothetical protein
VSAPSSETLAFHRWHHTKIKKKAFFFHIPHFSSILNNLSPEVYTRKTHNKKVKVHKNKMLFSALPILADSAIYRGSGKTHQ